jgi:hypothetical protein
LVNAIAVRDMLDDSVQIGTVLRRKRKGFKSRTFAKLWERGNVREDDCRVLRSDDTEAD